MIIDVHAHALSPAFMVDLARERRFGIERLADGTYGVGGYGPLDPEIYFYEKRLADLARRNVDVQLISPMPTFLAWEGGAADVEWARRMNVSTAQCVAESGGRFRGLAAVAWADPSRAADELIRAVDEHGFVGAAIGTYAGERALDDPIFEPVFAAMARRGLVVFMHPTSAQPHGRWQGFTLGTTLAWPNETTLAVTRLIYAGVLERHPTLHLALAHGGGNLAFMRGRIDLGYHAPKYEYDADCHKHIARAPSTYYKQMFFDTAVGAPEMLRFLIDLVGADRVVYGSDDPFEIADPKGEMAVPTVRALGPAVAERVLGGNLAAVLAAQQR